MTNWRSLLLRHQHLGLLVVLFLWSLGLIFVVGSLNVFSKLVFPVAGISTEFTFERFLHVVNSGLVSFTQVRHAGGVLAQGAGERLLLVMHGPYVPT